MSNEPCSPANLRFISLQDEWTKTVLERFSNPAVRDTIYRLNEDATNRIATCWAYGFLARPWDLRMWAIRFQQIPTFQAVALAPCLHEAKLWVEFCVSFWVFFNRLAGCGATWKVFVQVGGGNREPESGHSEMFNLMVSRSSRNEAFQCISCRLGWKDFDV